jgi:hypothetical protein
VYAPAIRPSLPDLSFDWRPDGGQSCRTASPSCEALSAAVKVYLTFDVEIWCNGWDDLDGRFPSSFERYVYGRSRHGDYALPKTLEILAGTGLTGVFFVEPLFAARFGLEHLATIVALIQPKRHDIQLHLHPEWTDEIRPLVFPGAYRKRQHLSHYTFAEQCTLLTLGRTLLADAGANTPTAFRAGSFAANADTYRALNTCGIRTDSSLNGVHPDSGIDLRGKIDFFHPVEIDNTRVLPMTVFRDGTGRLRPAQVGACSFPEMRTALESAAANGVEHFVVLSHNFEMLKPDRSVPDAIVVRRFQHLCAYLAANRDRYQVSTLDERPELTSRDSSTPLPHAGLLATLQRHGEQALRRVFAR